MQESRGAEIEHDVVAMSRDLGKLQGLDRRLCLTLGGPKGREIMLAEKQIRGLPHRRYIQRTVIPAGAIGCESRAYRMIEQYISIVARLGGKAGVKLAVNGLRPAHRNAIGQPSY